MSSKTIQVLMVDGNEDDVELIRRTLKGSSIEAELSVASSLAEAKAFLAGNTPDILIVGVRLPDGKGIELLPSDVEKRSMPIVIFTRHGDEKAAVAAIKTGAMDYIVKSDDTFANMPHVIERTLREWAHVVERRKTEKALWESEKEHRVWVENSPTCTKIVSMDSKLQFMSSSGVNALKIDDIAEYIGKPFASALYPEVSRNLINKTLEKVKETGESITHEMSVHDIEGQLLWFLTSFVAVYDDEGRMDYIMVVSTDITERKQVEEKLRDKFDEIELMNSLMIGRELKMEKLRKQISSLKEKEN